MKRFSLTALLVGATGLAAIADVLIATRQRTWDPPTAVSQAYITKDFEDRTGYVIVTDARGAKVQINRQLVVASFQLPELKPLPENVSEAYEIAPFISLQNTLAKYGAAIPKLKPPLLPTKRILTRSSNRSSITSNLEM